VIDHKCSPAIRNGGEVPRLPGQSAWFVGCFGQSRRCSTCHSPGIRDRNHELLRHPTPDQKFRSGRRSQISPELTDATLQIRRQIFCPAIRGELIALGPSGLECCAVARAVERRPSRCRSRLRFHSNALRVWKTRSPRAHRTAGIIRNPDPGGVPESRAFMDETLKVLVYFR